MDVADAIRGRRTHKSFDAEPVPRETLEELFEPRALRAQPPADPAVALPRARPGVARAAEGGGRAVEAPKLDRAPTLVVASVRLTGAQEQDEEDVCATAAAIYAVLLAAHARGLASYWRTPAVLRHARRPRGGRRPGRRARARPDPPRGAVHRAFGPGARARRELPRLPRLAARTVRRKTPLVANIGLAGDLIATATYRSVAIAPSTGRE